MTYRAITSHPNLTSSLNSLTKPKRRIINAEQLQAHLETAKARNPNREKIESLKTQARALFDEAAALTSDDEKYYNLLSLLSTDFDSHAAAAKCMEPRELGDHLTNLLWDHLKTPMSEAIFMEVLERIGWADDETE